MKKIFFSLAFLSAVMTASAQKTKLYPVNEKGFKKSETGLYYWIFKANKGEKPREGDFMEMNVMAHTKNDSILTNTYTQGGPMTIQLTKPQGKPDILEGLFMLSAGDSAAFMVPVDSLFHGGPCPPNANHGELIRFDFKVISIMTQAQYEQKMKDNAAKQIAAEAGAIQDYLKATNLTATKTESGLYYVVEKQGDGARAEKGKKLTMNYTGMLLNGEKFDSNIDPKFGHVQPFTFTLGVGQVIRGWDEGVALFNVGGKGKLIIPSTLGYGERGAGGAIPPNATLVFDIEVVNVE